MHEFHCFCCTDQHLWCFLDYLEMTISGDVQFEFLENGYADISMPKTCSPTTKRPHGSKAQQIREQGQRNDETLLAREPCVLLDRRNWCGCLSMEQIKHKVQTFRSALWIRTSDLPLFWSHGLATRRRLLWRLGCSNVVGFGFGALGCHASETQVLTHFLREGS